MKDQTILEEPEEELIEVASDGLGEINLDNDI